MTLEKLTVQEEREVAEACQKRASKEALAGYLEGMPWDYFFTVTTRKPWHDAIALNKRVYEALASVTAMERAFVATEPYYLRSGVHAHGLAKVDAKYKEFVPTGQVWDRLFHRFGRSKVDMVRSPEKVSAYCAKYVVKSHGDYNFWGRHEYWQGGVI